MICDYNVWSFADEHWFVALLMVLAVLGTIRAGIYGVVAVVKTLKSG